MSLVDSKHLPAYQLEKQLDNYQRGVAIRYIYHIIISYHLDFTKAFPSMAQRRRTIYIDIKVKMLKERIALRETSPITELRGVTCHMGSHSVTCHPTQVNMPRLNPSQ